MIKKKYDAPNLNTFEVQKSPNILEAFYITAFVDGWLDGGDLGETEEVNVFTN